MHYSSSQINFQGQPLFFARFVGNYSAPNNIDTLIGLKVTYFFKYVMNLQAFLDLCC